METPKLTEIIGHLEKCTEGLPQGGLKNLISDLKLVANGGEVLDADCLRIGDQVRMFCDNNWYGVVTAVELRMGRKPRYCIEYREGRDIKEQWLCKEQLDAFTELGKVEV